MCVRPPPMQFSQRTDSYGDATARLSEEARARISESRARTVSTPFTQPAMTGWLWKKPFLLNAFGSDQYLFFTLDSNTDTRALCYYEKKVDGPQRHLTEYLRGQVAFGDVLSVDQHSEYVFSIATAWRVFEMRAESAAEAEKWVNQLRRVTKTDGLRFWPSSATKDKGLTSHLRDGLGELLLLQAGRGGARNPVGGACNPLCVQTHTCILCSHMYPLFTLCLAHTCDVQSMASLGWSTTHGSTRRRRRRCPWWPQWVALGGASTRPM